MPPPLEDHEVGVCAFLLPAELPKDCVAPWPLPAHAVYTPCCLHPGGIGTVDHIRQIHDPHGQSPYFLLASA